MRLFFFVLLILTAGCENQKKEITPEMEKNARKNADLWLQRDGLSLGKLLSSTEHFSIPEPDFTFFYLEGGRCIEVVVQCYAGTKCSEVSSYPHHEHGEKCPIPIVNNK